jgi:hypothetical protein
MISILVQLLLAAKCYKLALALSTLLKCKKHTT